jgi:tetratricopeptide (TPR) repeat protein
MLTLIALIYIFALLGSFVWDDDTNILKNPLVRGDIETIDSSLPGLFEPYPVFFASLRLQWWLFGERPTGYLVVNILLHALNALLFWMLLRKLRLPAAFLSALFFAAHPVAVHAVAWISQHKTVLSTTLYLLCGLAFLRYQQKGGLVRHLGAIALFVSGLLTKPTLVMLPVILLLVDYATGQKSWKKSAGKLWPWFVVAVAAGLIRMYWLPPPELQDAASRVGEGWIRAAVAGCSLLISAFKMVFPLDLMMIYPRWDIATWTPLYLLPLLMLFISLGVLWRFRSRIPVLCWGVFFYVLAMLPVSGLFDNTYFAFAQFANHWMYPALLGLLPVLATSIAKISSSGMRTGWRFTRLVPALFVIALASLAAGEAYRFHDAQYYYERAVLENPDNVIAQQNLANILLEQGDGQGALKRYLEAARIHPDLWQAQVGAGKILAEQGKPGEAFERFRSAYEVFPESPEVNFHLGVLYGQAGMHEEAINHLGYSLQINPMDPVAWFNFGAAWLAIGEKDNARAAFEQSLVLDPAYKRPLDGLMMLDKHR